MTNGIWDPIEGWIPSEEHIDEALEYQALVENFDEYEQAYKEYLDHERSIYEWSPAISAADLFKRPKLSVTSYAEGFVYAGCLNLVSGEPKAGKSTLVWHIVNAISQGAPFLNKPTRKSRVLYVTEQNEVSFRQETQGIEGFSTNPNLFILLPEDAQATTWLNRIEEWGEIATKSGSSIIVIDTFGAFSSLPVGGENDAASISERMMQLKKLYKGRPNLAIILVHHVRKPSSDPKLAKEYADLRDARGSNSIVGCVDHCVMLSKGSRGSTFRNIHTEGRVTQESYGTIKLTDMGYKSASAF